MGGIPLHRNSRHSPPGVFRPCHATGWHSRGLYRCGKLSQKGFAQGVKLVEKIYRFVAVIVLVMLCAAFGIFAVSAGRDLGELRRVVAELESRNRSLERQLNDNTERLGRIASRLADGQNAVASASGAVERIRKLVDTIEAISLELRKPPVEIAEP